MEPTSGVGQLSQSEKLLYSQFRKKINCEAARGQVKKLEYNLADVTAGLNSVKSACADAASLGLGGVCIFPSYVKSCAAYLGAERKCSLIACISTPHGGDSTPVKVKAVKLAIRDGADEVEVTAPIAYIRDGNFSYVKREFKKLRSAAKKHAVRINLECGHLTKEQTAKACQLAADCGIHSVKATSSALRAANDMELITQIKNIVKDKCTIKAEGIATVLEMSGAIDMGANVIGSKNAAEVARTILAAAETE